MTSRALYREGKKKKETQKIKRIYSYAQVEDPHIATSHANDAINKKDDPARPVASSIGLR